MFILFISSFAILFIICFIICETYTEQHFENIMISVLLSFILSVFICLITDNIKTTLEKDLQNCKETVSLIVPEIVYANDSSFKVLKYNHKNFPEKIIINVGDSLYSMNDSDYIVEPCEQKILKKRK